MQSIRALLPKTWFARYALTIVLSVICDPRLLTVKDRSWNIPDESPFPVKVGLSDDVEQSILRVLKQKNIPIY